MRLFFALPLPGRLADQLGDIAFALPDLRPVDPDSLHLTLHFLGELDDAMAEEAARAAEGLLAGPVRLRLDGLGSFPAGRGLSLHAVVAPDPGLSDLHHRLGSRLAGAGLALPRRRFRPHVTLGRAPRMTPRLETALAAHVGLAPPPVAPARFGLYRSWLRPEGAQYERLVDYPLVLPVS
ncbi:RNA 2',3'-cyclic phosphodiesterase [Frigidibacter sp. MR17.24]|uniref:RNA 2',3'-cyclic phosphodiesterase n=1 Tax=Frigidibacter sp. MR17.24 TaxID=3127345 RepID=UPI00301313A9